MNEKNELTVQDLKGILFYSAILIALMFGISAWAWGQIPAGELVPTHWGIDGQPDAYGSKTMGLLSLPGIAVLIVVLLALVPRLDPRRRNLAQSQKAYTAVWASILTFMALLHIGMVLETLGRQGIVGILIPIATGILFIIIGNYLSKVRSTFTFGIRTPWTLTSEESWRKTHRLGGRLFMLLGALIALSAFFGMMFFTFLLIISSVGLIIFLFGYSYIVWKQDPQAIRN